MKIEVVFLIVTIIAVLVVIILIIGLRAISSSIRATVYPPLAKAEFNYSCLDRPCNSGFVCDPQFNLCKLDVGQPCLVSSDCATGNYCSGVCVPRDISPSAITGVTGGNCPCNYNTHSCIDGACLSLTSCVSDSDCVTGSCNGGLCATREQNGSSCVNNSQCASFNCSLGICQIPGVETGVIGSQCVGGCNGILICDSGFCRLP